jgi:phospholipid transport system substrate-binding protein
MAAAAALPFASMPAFALSSGQAEKLIDKLVAEVMSVINSGKSEAAMFKDFEKIFAKYADVPTVAKTSLGTPWRSASAAQQKAYVKAFSGYLARKYGRRFRDFIGSDIKVSGARKVKSFYVVSSTVKLRGSSPFSVEWHVSDRSGKDLMFNLVIEGINMIKSEREEIGNMLEKRGRKLDKLIAHLKTAG